MFFMSVSRSVEYPISCRMFFMNRYLRRILFIAFLLAIAGLIVYAFLPKPVPVDIAAVTLGPMQVTVDEDGKTRIKDRYVISAPLAGQLVRIQLKPGDNATANTTMLAVIEPRDPELLDPRAKVEALARVSGAQSLLDQSIPNLDRAAALMEMAKKDADKQRSLRQRNAGTEKEYDDALLMERVRTQEYNSAKFAQEIAKFALAQAKAALIRTDPSGPDPSSHFEIRAPCNGRVLRVFQESSAVVQAGTPLLEFGDPSDLEAEIDVLSTDAVKIQRGAEVIIDRWGGKQPLRGKVRVIEPSGFTKVSSLGVEEQRVNIIVDFVDPPDARATLGDGYRIEARIVIQEEDSVLRVPTSALFRDGPEWAVFVVEGGKAKIRRVKIGMQTALEAQVIEGLQEKEEVVAHPSDSIRDGVAVVRR
jgi:HlyD family secretion protein